MLYYPHAWAVLEVIFQFDTESPQLIVAPIRRATLHSNDYRNADTWELTFSSRVLPLDPDMIFSLAAEIYLFDAGKVTSDPEPFISELDEAGNLKYLEMAGLAIEAELSFDEEGGTFVIHGEDYTGLLISREWPSKETTIKVGSPIDATVQQLVDEAVFAKDHGGSTLRVVFRPDSLMPTAPIVGHGFTTAWKHGIPVDQGSSYWDAIYKLCMKHGCIVSVRGTDVVISAPATLTDDRAKAARRVAHGRSLQSLTIKRNVGHRPAPTIIASSFDPETRTVIEASWPPHSESTSRARNVKRPKGSPPAPKQLKARAYAGKQRRPMLHGTGQVKDEIKRVLPPPGITSVDALKSYVRAYHAQVSRGESEIHFTTKRLTDLDGQRMINVRTGDAVWIEWDQFQGMEMRQLSEDARYERLVRLGYHEDIAGVIARNFNSIEMISRPFYVAEASKEWDHQDGLSLEIEAINYVDPGRHGDAHVDAREAAETAIAPLKQAMDGNALFRRLMSKPAIEPEES